MLSDALLGVLIAFAIATFSTPVGVSGAVFLVPVQVSVLSVPSPSLTPTNLLYNLIAIPGALRQFAHQGRLGGRLMKLLLLGTSKPPFRPVNLSSNSRPGVLLVPSMLTLGGLRCGIGASGRLRELEKCSSKL